MLRSGYTLQLLLIAFFGAAGTLARYSLQGLVQVRAGSAFPYGTLLINLTGCFFLGLIGQFSLNRLVLPSDWRLAITVGFFGGYTTFSSFGWETAKMLEGRRVVARIGLRGRKRGGRPAAICGRHSPRQQILVAATVGALYMEPFAEHSATEPLILSLSDEHRPRISTLWATGKGSCF